MENLIDLENKLNTEFHWGRSSGATNNVANSTAAKIKKHVSAGDDIYIGNNPFMDKAKKWEWFHLTRLAQTNSRYHGRSIRTIWAVSNG